MNTQPQLSPSSVQYHITTDVHPGALSRVLQIFELRGITPDLLKVRQYQQSSLIRGNLSIDLYLSGLSETEEDVILQKLLSQVCVQSVRKENFFQRNQIKIAS